VNPVEEARIGFLITRIHVEKAWVRGDTERFFSEPKIVGIHGIAKGPQEVRTLKSLAGERSVLHPLTEIVWSPDPRRFTVSSASHRRREVSSIRFLSTATPRPIGAMMRRAQRACVETLTLAQAGYRAVTRGLIIGIAG
jgi:hypothetical protein